MENNNCFLTQSDEVIEEDLPTNNNKCYNLRQGLCALLGFIHYCIVAMMASIGHILISQLRNDNMSISQDQVTWIMSIGLLSMSIMCILSGILMQKVSKRVILFWSFTVELTGWMINYIFGGNSVLAIIIGRFIIGFADGMAAPVIPLFLAEVIHPKSRGLCISFVFSGLSVGIMSFNIAGAFLTWKTCVLITSSLAILSILLILYLKESYVWHLKKNDVRKVRESFYWYRGNSYEAKQEVSKYIREYLEKNRTNKIKLGFTSDFKGNMKLLMLPLFLTVTLMTTMHLSGYKVIVFYSINIMGGVIPSLDVYIATIIVDLIRLFSSLIGCVLVRKCPMRLLIMISGIGSAISHCLFCLFKYFSYLSEHILSILSLVSVVMFILLASIGLAALPWVLCSEIFPLKVKNIGSGISTFAYYSIFFLSIKFSPLLEIHFGIIGEFIFFCCCTTVGTLLMYFFMPETKNKTLGDIEDVINVKTKV